MLFVETYMRPSDELVQVCEWHLTEYLNLLHSREDYRANKARKLERSQLYKSAFVKGKGVSASKLVAPEQETVHFSILAECSKIHSEFKHLNRWTHLSKKFGCLLSETNMYPQNKNQEKLEAKFERNMVR